MLWVLAINAVLYAVARVNYLLFHALVEGFAIVVVALIYVLGTRTYQHSKNDTFLLLGIAYLNVAILDFAHTLTYKGMGVFPGFGSDTPTQLWIAGRFVEALSFLMVLLLWGKKINHKIIGAVYAFVTSLLLLSIMVFRVFPACFIEGSGLTRFKIMSEYVIIAILLGCTYVLYYRQQQGDREKIFKTIGLAMLFTALSELSFTLYTDVYGVANMVGHMLKIVSYYYVYRGVLLRGIDEPYSLMAAKLREGAIKDPLTNLYNRQGMTGLMEEELDRVSKGMGSMGVLMIDFDKFKLINDNYGHIFGDKVLRDFADLLQDTIREGDIAFRYGGDEFVVLLRDINQKGLAHIKERIQSASGAWIANNEKLRGIGISIGTTLLKSGQVSNIDNIIRKADECMYKVKEGKSQAVTVRSQASHEPSPLEHKSRTVPT